MADNLITTNITANADFTGLRTQLAATTAQLLKLQEVTAGTNAKLANQIAVMNKAFATTLTSTGQFSQHFVSLTSDVEKFGRNLDRGQLKLNNYFQTWQGHTRKTSTLVRDLAKQQVMMEQAIIQPIGKNAQGLMQYNVMVAKGLDEVKNRTAIARQELAIMNKVMLDGSNQLINWGKNTQWAGRQLTVGLTVPLAAFGMAAQKAFREADQELVRLTKVYGGLSAVSATELAKVRKDVSDTAREIAGSYGIAFKDTIALAADLAATGQQGEALLKATKETSRLAVLGEVDRQEAMKATLAIQNAFKSSTDELTQSIDFLNAVENQTSTSLADLVEAIPKAGPVVQSLGGDVKDLALYLTAMKEGGVNASEGANAIKSAMASLINPTKVAKEMFTGFGINIDQIVTSNAGNLTATIVELQSALDNLDPLSKSRAIEQLFGKFQYARMSALFENLGKEGSQTLQVMDLMKASATDLANISSRELGMMTESASGKFKRALASVQADLAAVGNQFLTISTKVLEVVDGIIKFFQKLPQPVKTFLNVLGGITAVSGPLIMLAGVMGNFIGYVIKGIFHLRQLARGGQGFKLLTPEIMAADAAAKGLATSFYSDTEATVVLTNAINTLAASFDNLEIKANSAKVAVQPGISTVAGSVISAGTPGGQRIVDKNNPLVGKSYTRDMSHFTPTATEQMGTIFGTVPGAKPVNIRIGSNPQSYMDSDLPRIPGVTSVNGISTGIVAQEAAKWHAMTAAIAMQSESELKLLKAEVMSTGTVTASLSDSYQALLPQFTEITSLAAQETAAIVKQLQASKITVDQARAKILQLNATVEAMLAETTALTASTMGRTANLTTVPLTSQPVVDPATGKSNMKEMFHKGPTKTLVDRIARALGGVRTSGAGYNIETTKPKFNKGGIVPGTGNTDTYHTTAEEGSFVINKAGTEANMPIIQNLLGGRPVYRNRGGQVPVVLTPGEAVIPADIAQKDMPLMYSLNGGPGNTGFGLSEGGNPDWGTWKKILRLQERYQNAFEPGGPGGWQKELAHRSVMHDATVLNNKGIPIDQAVEIASENYRQAMLPKPDGAMGENGTIDKKVWREIRQKQFNTAVKLVRDANSNVDPKNRRQLNTDAVGRIGASDARPTPAMLDYINNNPDKFGGKDFVDRLFKDLGFEKKSGKWVIDKYGKVSATNLHSTHTSPDAKWGYKSAGNFGQAFWGEADLNTAANDVRRALSIKGQRSFSYFPDEVLMTDKAIALQDRSWLKRFGTTVPQAILDRRKGIISLPQLFKLMRRGVASKSLGFGQIAKTANKGGEIEGRFAQGGEIPGKFAQRLFGGGKAMFLGMPKTIKQVEAQRAARAAMEKADQAVKNSRYSKDQVTTYDEKLQSDDKGHSFPVSGIGGIYSRNGEKFFVKPVVSEKRALAESRFNEITNDLENGLKAPNQRVVVIKDPTDPAGRRKVLALESKYDTDFANMPDTFDEDTYFKQLSLSALRGDKDLARGNLGGNRVADGGTSGVFNTASGDSDYSATMPSFKHQAFVNLLGVKGSNTKKFFAEATSDIPKGMTADQYHQRMLDEIENVLPRLKQTISRFDLNPEETVVYNAMIQRLSDARRENYRDLHALHSSIEITPKKQMTPAAIAKMIAADELKRRQKGHAASLSDNDFKNDSNGFNIGGMIGNVLKGRAMHRIGAGFGPTGAPKPSMYESAPWGVNSLSIEMADKLFANTGLRKHTQKLFYDKFAAALAKEKPYGYVKMPDGKLKNGLEPDVLDSVIRSAASDLIGDRNIIKQLSPIDKDILRNKYLNWDSKKDTPLTESLKKIIFGLEKREMGGPVNSGQPYIVGEKGPELFVPRNSGGIVPSNKYGIAQGYNMGGMIKMMLMQMLGAYGGQAAGKASGIPGGDFIGMMLGSMLGMGGSGFGGGAKAPMTSKGKLTAPIGATKALEGVTVNGKDLMVLTKYGERLEKASLEGGKFAKMGAFAAKSLTRLNLIVGAGSLAIGIAINRYKAHQESMRLNALGYGMTAEQAEKAGLKFTNFNDKIKEAIANAKALKERNTLLYESMQGSGTPINVTIEEYKKLKKEVKDNYSDQVLLINKTSADEQEALAIRLKEQLIAMGVSAEEASKKIYTMYASSEFASIASKVTVGSKGKFNEIKDTATAAASALESLNAAMATDRDPTEQANQLNTALMALSTDVEKRQADAVKKERALATKEGRYFSSGDEKQAKLKAEEEAIEAINKDVQSQAVLTREVVDEMAKIDPSIRQIVSEQDTALSLWQKTRIQVKGYTGDLRNLTAAQTNDLYQLQIALGKVIESANRAKGGALEKQYAKLDRDKQRQAAYERAAKGQKVADQISDREKMSALQKQIDLNNKLADARIKALTAAKEEGDIAREIAKKQAEYDAAIATGNTAGAQQASLDMEGLQSQLQFNAQVKNEENARDVKNAPLLKQIEAMQKKQQKLSDNAAIAGEKLGDLTKSIATQESAIDAVNSSMLDYQIKLSSMEPAERKKWEASRVAREQLAAIGDAAQKAGIKIDGLKDIDLGARLMKNLESGLGSVKTIVTNGEVTIMVGKDAFKPGKGGDGSYGNPFQGGSASVALGEKLGVPIRETITEKGWDTSFGPTSDREIVKKYAKQQDFAKDTQFTLTNKDGSVAQFKVVDDKFNVQLQKITPAEKKAMGGQVNNYDNGGGVSGPGTKTSDSIPAMLSDGEWVIKADSVEKAKKEFGSSFFDDLNAGKFHEGGKVGHKHGSSSPTMPNPFGMGMEWFGKTLSSAANSVVKNVLGFDITTPFSKKSKTEFLSMALLPVGGGAGKGISSSVPKVAGAVSHLTPEMKSFGMADIDAKAMQALSKMDLSSIKIPETGISFNPSSAKAALEGLKEGVTSSSTWEIIQAQRETLLKKKYPKIDFSDVTKFNEYYAKEFYDLLPDEAIKLFKGVRGTIGDAWRTGQKDLGTYFSTNPHIAALYSAMIGKAKLGEELPMFGIDKKISELKNFLGEGAIRNGSAQGSMEFPQVLGGDDLLKMLPSIYSLPGQVYGQMFGATAKSLKEIKNLWPSGFASGGYVNPTYSAKMSVPSFDSGINSVPVDMLAMIHKNEAVVPANMNPFNPNANNATMGGATYNITNNINGYDGDLNQLSRMVTQQTVTAIKSMDSRAASALGPKMNVGIS
jgi:TP901 family phage tail tape measure protein